MTLFIWQLLSADTVVRRSFLESTVSAMSLPDSHPPPNPEAESAESSEQDAKVAAEMDEEVSTALSSTAADVEPETLTHCRCPNCGAIRTGPFCAQCGQQDRTRIGPLRELAADVVDELFSVDTRLLRTLKHLVTRPGALTADYIHGRRAAYYRPFRLFVLSGLLLLLMTSLGRTLTDSNGGAMLKPMVQIPYSEAKIEETRERAEDVRARGSLPDLVHSVFINATANAAENPERINRIAQERLSILAAVLLPASAFLLYLLFPGRFFTEHVVHSLHLHTFTFLVLSTYLAVSYSVRSIDMGTLASITVPISALTAVFAIAGYNLISFRRVYHVSIGTAIWKGATTGILYLFVFVGAVILYMGGALLFV